MSHSDDDDDGAGSVVSTMSTRSRRNSGLEGGALNAFLGDESIARNASRGRGFSSGGTVVTSRQNEKFMRDRKSRQDLIMDVAKKEKWQHEAKAREEAEHVERVNKHGFDSDSSDDEDERLEAAIARDASAATDALLPDPVADRKMRHVFADSRDLANHLVTGNKRKGRHAPGILQHAEITVTDPTGLDVDIYVVGSGVPDFIFEWLERAVSLSRSVSADGFHGFWWLRV